MRNGWEEGGLVVLLFVIYCYAAHSQASFHHTHLPRFLMIIYMYIPSTSLSEQPHFRVKKSAHHYELLKYFTSIFVLLPLCSILQS